MVGVIGIFGFSFVMLFVGVLFGDFDDLMDFE